MAFLPGLTRPYMGAVARRARARQASEEPGYDVRTVPPMKPLVPCLAVAVCCLAAEAHGYCRTTTCSALPEGCEIDAHGCPANGRPVAWPEPAIELLIDPRGSPRRGISAETTRALTETAVRQWLGSDCGGIGPTIDVAPLTVAAPDVDAPSELVGYDGINLITFQDDLWPHIASNHAVGLTTVTYTVDTGRIVDTDIEINSFAFRFTVDDKNIDFDLLGLLTHEVGHVFGLNDLPTPGPTMYGRYVGGGLAARSLEPDDQAGMCAVYPPDRFQSQGGCQVSAPLGARAPGAAALLALLLLPLRRRKRT